MQTSCESNEIAQISMYYKFARMCGYDSQKIQTDKAKTIKDEVNAYRHYLSEKFLFRDFWEKKMKSLPMLGSIVKEISMIPATSVASESAFSIANYVNRKERSSLSFKQLRYSMLNKDIEKVTQLLVTTFFF